MGTVRSLTTKLAATWRVLLPSLRRALRTLDAFPNHRAQAFANAGHFVAEGLGPDAADPIEGFLNANS
jgi:hypothetical protein